MKRAFASLATVLCLLSTAFLAASAQVSSVVLRGERADCEPKSAFADQCRVYTDR